MGKLAYLMAFFLALVLFCEKGLAQKATIFGIRNSSNQIDATLMRGDSLFIFSKTGPRIYDRVKDSIVYDIADYKDYWNLNFVVSAAGIPGGPIWLLSNKPGGAFRWQVFKWWPGLPPELVVFDSVPPPFIPVQIIVGDSGEPWFLGYKYLATFWQNKWIWAEAPLYFITGKIIKDDLYISHSSGLNVYKIANPPVKKLSYLFNNEELLERIDTIRFPYSDSRKFSNQDLGVPSGEVNVISTDSESGVWLGTSKGLAKWDNDSGVLEKYDWPDKSFQSGMDIQFGFGDTVWISNLFKFYVLTTQNKVWREVSLPYIHQIDLIDNQLWASGSNGLYRKGTNDWELLYDKPHYEASVLWDHLYYSSNDLFFHNLSLNSDIPSEWSNAKGQLMKSNGLNWRQDGKKWYWSSGDNKWNEVKGPDITTTQWRAGPDTSAVVYLLNKYWIITAKELLAFNAPNNDSNIFHADYLGDDLYIQCGYSLWKHATDGLAAPVKGDIQGFDVSHNDLLAWSKDSIFNLRSGKAIGLPINGGGVLSAYQGDSIVLLGSYYEGLWIHSQNRWTVLTMANGLPENTVQDVACSNTGDCWVLGDYTLTKLPGIAKTRPNTPVSKKGNRKKLNFINPKVYDLLGRRLLNGGGKPNIKKFFR